MSLHDFIPLWGISLVLLAWALLLVLYANGGRRALDVGAKARAIPRVLLALYYLVLWLHPGFFELGAAHLMGRAGLIMIALSDMVYIVVELAQRRQWQRRRAASYE